MKILWISFVGSWTLPLLNILADNKHQFAIILPSIKGHYSEEEKLGIKYFHVPFNEGELLQSMTTKTFKKIIKNIRLFDPDIIHVHGTERNFAQIQNFISDIPVVTSIQGILVAYEPFVQNYLNVGKVKRFASLKNLLGRGGISVMPRTLEKGKKFELDILEKGNFFIGRTHWDNAHVALRNPNAVFYQGEELLRDDFYNQPNKWNHADCQKHSIFMPSGFNPIKGLHHAIEVVRILKNKYPLVKLYVPGVDLSYIEMGRFKSRLIGEEYISYIKSVIKRNNLNDNVTFVGSLNASEMCGYMLKSHVFLSPSSIDNSPNAVGEAMMTGIPIVTTPVGGVTSFVIDNENSLLASSGDAFLMAFQIERIFRSKSLAERLSKNAQKVAARRHNRDSTKIQYQMVYRDVISRFRKEKLD